jgi:hypothetical protein
MAARQRLFSPFLLLVTIISFANCQYLQSTYDSSNTYYDRYLLDSPYNLCRDPLMARANISATTEASQRTSEYSRLWGGSAWTADNSDFQQALIIDLGQVKNVTGIATQGRAHSDEYIIEYRMQYGSNGKDWIDYKEVRNDSLLRERQTITYICAFSG